MEGEGAATCRLGPRQEDDVGDAGQSGESREKRIFGMSQMAEREGTMELVKRRGKFWVVKAGKLRFRSRLKNKSSDPLKRKKNHDSTCQTPQEKGSPKKNNAQ